MDRLRGRRVGIVGTGATAAQCVPRLARVCRELYAFQRIPSSVDVRGNRPTDPQWFALIATPGWQRRWQENFAASQTGGHATEDLVMDGWTDISRRVRARIISLPPGKRTPGKISQCRPVSSVKGADEVATGVPGTRGQGTEIEVAGKLPVNEIPRPAQADEPGRVRLPGHPSA